MSSPASIKEHPIHPMLITIPIGLWVFSLVADIIYVAGSHAPVWNDVAYYTMVGGIVGALLAAVPGLIDYLSITDAKTKKTGTKHLILNLGIVALYVVNVVVRTNGEHETTFPFVLSIVSVALLVYSGWLGGDMVYEHGMAVELESDGRLKKGRVRPYEEPKEERGHAPAPQTRM